LPDLPDRIRAFVALRLSAEVECAIAELVNPLRDQQSGIRWVRPSNLHLTLRFLGNAVERRLLVALDQRLNQVTQETTTFTLHARGVGAFPNLDRPHTIWVGLVSEQLVRLARGIEDAAIAVGFAPEPRAYTPHLTIGRVRDLHRWQRVRQVLQSSVQEFGSTLISEMTLYRSILGGEAAQYRALASYRFSAEPRLR
jgi:RNA 2',3'-cyclic 3'-phosphodiesterase